MKKAIKCPKCKSDWPKDCEQAVSVELYGSCVWCNRFNSKVDFKEIQRIQKDRGYTPPEDNQ